MLKLWYIENITSQILVYWAEVFSWIEGVVTRLQSDRMKWRSVKTVAFWNVAPCNLADKLHLFRGTWVPPSSGPWRGNKIQNKDISQHQKIQILQAKLLLINDAVVWICVTCGCHQLREDVSLKIWEGKSGERYKRLTYGRTETEEVST